MNIFIDDKEIQLKYTFRAMMIYENITEKTFEPKGITEFILLFYSIVMASDKELSLSINEFMDWLDNNQDKLNEFIQWLSHTLLVRNEMSQKSEDGDGEKKT